MNNPSAICLAACLIPNLAAAQAAPEHHIWQDKGPFEPMSRTAEAITGPIKLSGNPNFATPGSKMTLTFGNGNAVELTSVGASWREWDDVRQEKVTAEVFRLDHDPGMLLQGNSLCGGDPKKNPARFIVFFGDQTRLGVDVFESKNGPRDINSPGLCGTFSFYAPKTEAPAAADIKPHSPPEAQRVSEPPDAMAAYQRGDYAAALGLLRPLISKSDPSAEAILALMYENGYGVSQDYTQALAWCRKSADQGNMMAEHSLGRMYDNGKGVPQDYAQAVLWYRKAADQGFWPAQYSLGRMYDIGLGVPQDYGQALKLYRDAAKQGDALAQESIADMYEMGHGVPQDYTFAVAWYHAAANQGNADAQMALGDHFEEGRGVSQGNAQALDWYRRAADQGGFFAQMNLGQMYFEGRGAPQDYVQAHLWFNLAASGASSAAIRDAAIEFRDKVAAKMTSAQIGEAQKLAREWVRKK